MAIPDFTIKDLATFNAATEEPRQMAGLYFYQALDCLIDLAYAVALDSRKTPQLYRDLGGEPGKPSILQQTLARLRAQYGTEVTFPSKAQRNEIYEPLFGGWGASPSESDSFPQLRDQLFQAVSCFAECAVDKSVDMLRASVRNRVTELQNYLIALQGDSVRFSKENALADLTEATCYPILRSEKIRGVFGICKPAAATDYPYNTDPDIDIMIEEMAKQLHWVDGAESHITRRQISDLQMVARQGASAIATVLAFTDGNQTDADVDVVTLKCYQWATAVRCVGWRDGGYYSGYPAPHSRERAYG